MATLFDDKHGVRLIKAKGRFHAHLEGLAVHGSGETPEAALAALAARYDELKAFSQDSGVPLSMLGGTVPKSRNGSGLKTAALIVVCFGLMMVPLSYALSTAVERSLSNLDLKGGRQFWTGLEDGLIKSADPKSAPDPERQARTVEALHTLALRLKPYADAVRPLFAGEPLPPDQDKPAK